MLSNRKNRSVTATRTNRNYPFKQKDTGFLSAHAADQQMDIITCAVRIVKG